MYLHSLTLCQYTFNIFSLDMSILFCTFAVEIKITFSPPETRIIGKYMIDTLKHVSTDSLQSACAGLNAVLDDLKEELGEKRFSNEFYIKLLNLENLIVRTWINRVREQEGF